MRLAHETTQRFLPDFMAAARAHPDAGPREMSRMFPEIAYATAHKWLMLARGGADMRRAVEQRPHSPEQDVRVPLSVRSGHVVVFSDAHFWPGIRSTAFRGLLKVMEKLSPAAIVSNGDMFDGASISRWPRIGWDKRPTVAAELGACTDRMAEIERASRGATLLGTFGNHDQRFDTSLAASSPQFEGVSGFRLSDHLPAWRLGWGVWLNDSVVIKHRWRGGIHAARNNALNSGMTTVTGHLHSLKVTPVTDYNGTRYGVDSGTLADVRSPQFDTYTEDGPKDWRSGFVVLTFDKGRLLWPRVAHVIAENEIEFGGEVIRV